MGIFLKTLRSLFLHVVITLPFVCLLPLSVARVRPGVIVMAHSRKAIVDSPHIATNTIMICSSVLLPHRQMHARQSSWTMSYSADACRDATHVFIWTTWYALFSLFNYIKALSILLC